MTKREFWLKLFSENDTALAAAIHLCERFATPESLNNSVEFLVQKRRELNDEVDRETVEAIFPGYAAELEKTCDQWIEHIHFNDFGSPNGSNYECPNCHFDDVYDLEDYNHCPKCGKKIKSTAGMNRRKEK